MWVPVEDGGDVVSSRILILFIIVVVVVKFRFYILFLFNLYNTLVQITKRNLIYLQDYNYVSCRRMKLFHLIKFL